jgi:hypothetical protein
MSGQGEGKAARLEPDSDMVDEYAAVTEAAIRRVLRAMGDLEYQLSPQRLRDLSFHFLRDILRIKDRQSDAVAGTKFAGYWAFWIRKVRPILYAYDKESSHYNTDTQFAAEIPQINERVSLHFAISFLIEQRKDSDDFLLDPVRGTCGNNCAGSNCLIEYSKKLLSHGRGSMFEYIIYSMSYRTFGPHHMTMFLDQLVFGSCQAFPMQTTLTPPEMSTGIET